MRLIEIVIKISNSLCSASFLRQGGIKGIGWVTNGSESSPPKIRTPSHPADVHETCIISRLPWRDVCPVTFVAVIPACPLSGESSRLEAEPGAQCDVTWPWPWPSDLGGLAAEVTSRMSSRLRDFDQSTSSMSAAATSPRFTSSPSDGVVDWMEYGDDDDADSVCFPWSSEFCEEDVTVDLSWAVETYVPHNEHKYESYWSRVLNSTAVCTSTKHTV